MRVLVAIDGSEPAGIAVDLVAEAAWPAGTEILVAEAVESGAGLFGGPWPEIAMVQADTLEAELRGSPELMPIYLDAVAASRKQHGQLAREMTAELQAAGLRAEADRREGDAATEILAAASGSNTDLIVMGTHGRSGLARIVLGSVARNVLQHATCSVLITREGSPQAE